MPPVAIPWKLRDLHTSILSNNLHSGEINKYFWKFCLHLLMSKFYHWLVYMVFTRILKYYLSWWKWRHLCCWVKSLVATLQIMAEWPLRDREAVSLTTSACPAIFFHSSTESLLQDNVFVARSQHWWKFAVLLICCQYVSKDEIIKMMMMIIKIIVKIVMILMIIKLWNRICLF